MARIYKGSEVRVLRVETDGSLSDEVVSEPLDGKKSHTGRNWLVGIATVLGLLFVIGSIGKGGASGGGSVGSSGSAALVAASVSPAIQAPASRPLVTQVPATQPPAAAPPPPTAAQVSIGSGVKIVGKDIQPGTYRSKGGAGCYWEREAGFSGSLGDILANENASGPALVTVEPTDKGFKSALCELDDESNCSDFLTDCTIWGRNV